MLTTLLFRWLSDFHLDTISVADDHIIIDLTTTQAEGACPVCGQASSAIHSRYDRTVADLPWAQNTVCLHLHVRKFFCANPICPRVVFTERLPQVVAPSARRTQRLNTEQRDLARDLGGEAGARTAHRQGMPLSPTTLLRLLRRQPLAQRPTPRILGVDDFALRKGQVYGTLLVDLEKHQPVDLLNDRSAETLERWLKDHPGVEIISRDRAGAYADGASRGAPAAIQVADRFHLLQNLREVLQRVLERHQAGLQEAANPTEQSQHPTTEPERTDLSLLEGMTDALASAPPVSCDRGLCVEETTPERHTAAEQRRHEHREQREARYREVQALQAQGLSVRAIARLLHIGRRTVERFSKADQFPERGVHRPAPSKLDPYLPYLQQQLEAGQDNGLQLWRELRDQYDYSGSRALVSRWVARHRHLMPISTQTAEQPRHRGRPPRPAAASTTSARRVSARQASWLLVQRPDRLEDDERTFVERLRAVCSDVDVAYPLAQEFETIVRKRQAAAFEGWLARADASNVPELQRFVASLQRDKAAVVAAVSLPYSNGQVEGQITRLKMIKRSMYGRANVDLLRQRVLAA